MIRLVGLSEETAKDECVARYVYEMLSEVHGHLDEQRHWLVKGSRLCVCICVQDGWRYSCWKKR